MNKKIKMVIVAAIAALLLLTASSLWLLKNERSGRIELQNFYNASQDTLKIWKNKDGENVATISLLSFYKAQDFIKIKTKDSTIKELQDLVKKYKKQLNNGGSSATIIHTITDYDTTYVSSIHMDTIYFKTTTLLDSINNKWIHSRFGFINGNTTFSLSVGNSYSVVIGEDGRGLFRKKATFAEVTNYNPYTTTKVLRTYQVGIKKQRHWGIGPNFGASIVPVSKDGSIGFQFLPTIGIGVQYNLINF